MPKTIDYPRTTYVSAWEVAEVVDDTGGKAAIETAAKKLNRKVSGSFKAIIGSAVKFGLLTSKREVLTTTNLFRRIKHAYDKQEEKIFHREAFLHPPLFLQICRKFRNRELPVHMLDIMLLREFDVEEINAQNVAKVFVEGARAVDILDERNVITDVDQLATQQAPRRELASTEMPPNLFGQQGAKSKAAPTLPVADPTPTTSAPAYTTGPNPSDPVVPPLRGNDAVSRLFGLNSDGAGEPVQKTAAPVVPTSPSSPPGVVPTTPVAATAAPVASPSRPMTAPTPMPSQRANSSPANGYTLQISGPGIESHLSIQDVDDLEIAVILLEKIRKQLTR